MNTHLNLCIMLRLCTAILTQPLFKEALALLYVPRLSSSLNNCIIKQLPISLLPNLFFYIYWCATAITLQVRVSGYRIDVLW